MKIKTCRKKYSDVLEITKPVQKRPVKPAFFVRVILYLFSLMFRFTVKYEISGSVLKRPCLVLMNHTSSLDDKIVMRTLFPRPFSVIVTSDGFIGHYSLLRMTGAIPADKFVSSPDLVSDMAYALENNGSHVVLFPEARYSLDGCNTPLPDGMGFLYKVLRVPVVMIRTTGSYLREPQYNNLKKRKVKVRADVRLLFSKEDIERKTADELSRETNEAFVYDSFAWQKDSGILIKEKSRAEGLHRILYKCPHCMSEGRTVGYAAYIECTACGAKYELTESGDIRPANIQAENTGKTFSHIPDWFAWEKSLAAKEVREGNYRFECRCRIFVRRDYTALYETGTGFLVHDADGFSLKSDDGEINFFQSSDNYYSIYSDLNFYEIGDMIGIGDKNIYYYCFPAEKDKPVVKAEFAAEELYRIYNESRN